MTRLKSIDAFAITTDKVVLLGSFDQHNNPVELYSPSKHSRLSLALRL